MLPKTPTIITFVSLFPFVALSILLSFDFIIDKPHILNQLITYAAIIFSFIAGSRWGMAVDHHYIHDNLADNLYLLSAVMALLAWMVLLLDDHLSQLLILTLLYTLAWGVDSFLYSNKIIPLWFFTLRSMVTPVIIVSLYVGYFSIL